MAKKNNTVDESQILTKEGEQKLKDELNERMEVTRKEIANKLEAATDQGDLSENSAYKSALEEKELNENRITEIQDILANSVVRSTSASTSTVGIGNKVKLKMAGSDKEMEVTIVGKSEADPTQQMISVSSPIGAAIYGKSKGENVQVKLPTGETEVEITNIS